MWLRDFLPEFVPTARILIYGYDSQLKGGSSVASIFEFAKQFLDAVKTIRGPMVSVLVHEFVVRSRARRPSTRSRACHSPLAAREPGALRSPLESLLAHRSTTRPFPTCLACPSTPFRGNLARRIFSAGSTEPVARTPRPLPGHRVHAEPTSGDKHTSRPLGLGEQACDITRVSVGEGVMRCRSNGARALLGDETDSVGVSSGGLDGVGIRVSGNWPRGPIEWGIPYCDVRSVPNIRYSHLLHFTERMIHERQNKQFHILLVTDQAVGGAAGRHIMTASRHDRWTGFGLVQP
jgi:hypothetical protein